MSNSRTLGVAAALAFAATLAPAWAEEVPVQRGAVAFEAVTPTVFNGDLRDLPAPHPWHPGDPIREIPRQRRPSRGLASLPAWPQDAFRIDPLVALQQDAQGRGSDGGFSTLLLNQDGQGFTGVNPPDPSGEVGGAHYIQGINGGGGSLIRIIDKVSGATVTSFTLDSLGTANCASGAGDPIILYDHLASRWMLSEFSGSGNRLCVYISQTSDPVSGGWFAYSFTATNFPDYPKYGVWPDGYYVGTNENLPAMYAFDRVQMLAGAPATLQRFTTADLAAFGFQMIPAVDLDGPAPPAGEPAYFIRHNDDEAHSGSPNAAQDFLQVYEFDVDWATPANTTLTGPVNIGMSEISSNLCGFTTFSCLQQPGAANLDPLREPVMNKPIYRNFGTHEVLVGNLVTNVAANVAVDENAAVRWFELRKVGAGAWTLHQEGTLSGTPCAGVCDFPNRWMGSSAMDVSGNFAVAYNVASDTTIHPGLRYSGRLSTDGLNTLPQSENVIVAGTASNSSLRYGDYNHMSLDESDGCTFYFTGEYNVATSWSTRIASFRFAACSSGPMFEDGFETADTSQWDNTIP